MPIFDAVFLLLCLAPFLMLFGCMAYVSFFERRPTSEGRASRERCTDSRIRTINCTSNECWHCRGWIPRNTLGGGLKCSHCGKWQPEKRNWFTGDSEQ